MSLNRRCVRKGREKALVGRARRHSPLRPVRLRRFIFVEHTVFQVLKMFLSTFAMATENMAGFKRPAVIRTSIHDEYDLMLCWHIFLSILRV